jgi:hypothetical protein
MLWIGPDQKGPPIYGRPISQWRGGEEKRETFNRPPVSSQTGGVVREQLVKVAFGSSGFFDEITPIGWLINEMTR